MPGARIDGLLSRSLRKLRSLIGGFFRRSSTLEREPLNKASLLVIVLVDLFLLVNVFSGLEAISRWTLTPSQIYPCQAPWSQFRASSDTSKRFEIVRQAAQPQQGDGSSFRQRALAAETDHLGQVSPICLTYADHQDRIRIQPAFRPLVESLNRKQEEIGKLEQTNEAIRRQYDSTLLEDIAGQPRQRSINPVGAAQARETLASNDERILALQGKITTLKREVLARPVSLTFLEFLSQSSPFEAVERRHGRASFWAPSLRLLFQGLFLLPVVALALLVHRYAQRRGHGLLALVSWHLLVVALIPLICKGFEFVQIGVLFELLANAVRALFGNLLFLVSYLYILILPLLGFALIRFLQAVVFNKRVQAATRAQKSRCLRCARKLSPETTHCPHCGYSQFLVCDHCHQITYRHLPFCRSCGAEQIAGRGAAEGQRCGRLPGDTSTRTGPLPGPLPAGGLAALQAAPGHRAGEAARDRFSRRRTTDGGSCTACCHRRSTTHQLRPGAAGAVQPPRSFSARGRSRSRPLPAPCRVDRPADPSPRHRGGGGAEDGYPGEGGGPVEG
jgi:RNA polymerase subunit RPABC4/transcription elongation factor Spt4